MTAPGQPVPFPGDLPPGAPTGPVPTVGDVDAPDAAPTPPTPFAGDVVTADLGRTVPLRRRYLDALGHPLSGSVILTGSRGHTHGETVIPAAPVPVELVDGLLEVRLPPDTYRLSGELHTAAGDRVPVSAEIVLEEAP